MRAGVLAAIGGTVVVLVATGPASAFNSGLDPEEFYGPTVTAIDERRVWASEVEGRSYQPPHEFTKRPPDDEFDSLLLRMLNRFRSDNGLPPFAESDGLRTRAAIWSNVVADVRNAKAVDWWSPTDLEVACRSVTDSSGTSAFSDGRPEDVFDRWVATPAVRNALLAPGPVWVGLASVVEDGQWTTIRLVQGDCSTGSALPTASSGSPLPQPGLTVRVSPAASTVAITVERRGKDQLLVELQRHDGEHWVNDQTLYAVPAEPTDAIAVTPGLYRVSVPEQGGYANAFTEPITID